MGLLDGLFGGKQPTLNAVPLDPGTTNLVGKSIENATQSNDQLAGKLNSGVGQAGAQANQSDQALKQEAASTGQDPAMLSAIRNQYNKVAGQGVNRITRANEGSVAMTRAQWMDQATRSMLAQQQVETQNYAMLSNAQNQADMARAQVLSNVLGVAGMGAGMYLGSHKRSGPRAPAQMSPINNPQAGGPYDAGGTDPFSVV